MAVNSRAKGKRGELTAVHALNDMGFNTHRTQQFCGKAGNADVEGIPGCHLEIKNVERLNIYEAMEQADRDRREDEIPTVIHKKNNKPFLVTIKLSDSLEWARRWLYGKNEHE